MNVFDLPKHEDVLYQDENLSFVKLTKESRPGILKVIMSSYLDDVCMYCLRNFTPEEVNDAVGAYPNEHGRIVHKECWDENNET